MNINFRKMLKISLNVCLKNKNENYSFGVKTTLMITWKLYVSRKKNIYIFLIL